MKLLGGVAHLDLLRSNLNQSPILVDKEESILPSYAL